MRKILLLFAILLNTYSALAQWNSWNDAQSVLNLLNQAQDSDKCYFSQFHVYDVRGKDINSSKYRMQTDEVPYIYALDFYYATGSYFTDEYKQKNKSAIIGIVKKQWRENKSIPSFSWHLENPYVNSDFGEYMGCRYRFGHKHKSYPEEHRYVIKEILTNKGGSSCGYGIYNAKENGKPQYRNPRDWFKAQCNEVADIINHLIDDDGNPIPIIFRLWHECEDSWMWWGATSVSIEDYKRFFIYTEKQIIRNVHKAQILWAYCTDRNWNTREEFMARYPGDKYVDIIGYDDYEIGNPQKVEPTLEKARIVSRVSIEHGKVAALFETANSNSLSKDRFMSEYLYPLIESENVNLGLVQMWIGGPFENEIQYEDRKRFLKSPNILILESNE